MPASLHVKPPVGPGGDPGAAALTPTRPDVDARTPTPALDADRDTSERDAPIPKAPPEQDGYMQSFHELDPGAVALAGQLGVELPEVRPEPLDADEEHADEAERALEDALLSESVSRGVA